eukprot:gnl/Chilomastix_cuspidata/3332.p1 GENE.gnl/Chilomastix_cuspidata/3332~~gnl/Chilomastix_cuspidata/3332.p1  ORF type:complete len:3611 (-),score=172.86 gnl/Chilomastix_cuspidata/3332:1097-11722(-)
MSNRKYSADRRSYLGALKYLPHAILKLMENIPMPWEELRYVKVLYHRTGAVTFVNETPRVIEPVYVAQWASMWTAMRREKKDRRHFQRLRFPIFDDEEPPFDYGETLLTLQPLDPVELELDETEDASIIEWFYDHRPLVDDRRFVSGEGYRSYRLPLNVLSTLHRLASPLVADFRDKNELVLFDLEHLSNSKALSIALPGAPKFEPLFKPDDDRVGGEDEDWDDFNDINKIIVRSQIRTEHRLAYPFLYNSRPREVKLPKSADPLTMYIPPEKIEGPALEFSSYLTPLPPPRRAEPSSDPWFSEFDLNEEIENEDEMEGIPGFNCFSLPLDVDPLFGINYSSWLKQLEHASQDMLSETEEDENDEDESNLPPLPEPAYIIDDVALLDGIRIFWAPPPFNRRTGFMRRAEDVPIINHWIRQHQERDPQLKTRISYQKLLKNHVLRCLKQRKRAPGKKRSLTKTLRGTKYFASTTIDWLEAGLQLCRQGHNVLNLLIHRKNLNFLHLDYNFTLKPVKTLTTKERKRSRFGNSYHLVRELLRLTKLVVDVHCHFRVGMCDAYQLADALFYIFSHVGIVTGVYRHRYHVMHQIRMCLAPETEVLMENRRTKQVKDLKQGDNLFGDDGTPRTITSILPPETDEMFNVEYTEKDNQLPKSFQCNAGHQLVICVQSNPSITLKDKENCVIVSSNTLKYNKCLETISPQKVKTMFYWNARGCDGENSRQEALVLATCESNRLRNRGCIPCIVDNNKTGCFECTIESSNTLNEEQYFQRFFYSISSKRCFSKKHDAISAANKFVESLDSSHLWEPTVSEWLHFSKKIPNLTSFCKLIRSKHSISESDCFKHIHFLRNENDYENALVTNSDLNSLLTDEAIAFLAGLWMSRGRAVTPFYIHFNSAKLPVFAQDLLKLLSYNLCLEYRTEADDIICIQPKLPIEKGDGKNMRGICSFFKDLDSQVLTSGNFAQFFRKLDKTSLLSQKLFCFSFFSISTNNVEHIDLTVANSQWPKLNRFVFNKILMPIATDQMSETSLNTDHITSFLVKSISDEIRTHLEDVHLSFKVSHASVGKYISFTVEGANERFLLSDGLVNHNCKDLKHIIYSKFNSGPLKGLKGPGVGFWAPLWRVWIFYLRGVVPMLEKFLSNLLARQFEGRKFKDIAHRITKQRTESNFDKELQAAVLHDILDLFPEGVRKQQSVRVLQHLSEAWRCWRANIPWKVPEMPPRIEKIIERYVKVKADWWSNQARYNREQIKRGGNLEKTVCKKNLGRLARLMLKDEQERQFRYQREGPLLTKDEGVAVYMTMAHWLEARKFEPIPFPPPTYRHDMKLLTLALEKLKEMFSMNAQLNTIEREELALIEQSYDMPQEAVARIKRNLLTARTFKEADVEFVDSFHNVYSVQYIDPLEKITDSYLMQYLSYEAFKRGLFPSWIKPSDSEPAPFLVYKFCEGINSFKDIWSEDGSLVLVETKFENYMEQMDMTLLNRLLRLVMNHNLADYITAKNNISLTYKDMTHNNRVGFLKGFQFSSFVAQFYGLVLDLLLIGLQRANDIAGAPEEPNQFLKFPNSATELKHPIRGYMRYFDKVYLIFKFRSEQANELINRYMRENPETSTNLIRNYPIKRGWPLDERMKLKRRDVTLGRAVFWSLQNRMPASLCTLSWEKSFVSVYSKDNPNLHFEMCTFDIRMTPTARLPPQKAEARDGLWSFSDEETKEKTAVASVRISEMGIKKFHDRLRMILMSSGSTTFQKIANRWNSALIGFVVFYREAILNTPTMLDLLVKMENKIQTRIKIGLNSKMPTRFPPVVFYCYAAGTKILMANGSETDVQNVKRGDYVLGDDSNACRVLDVTQGESPLYRIEPYNDTVLEELFDENGFICNEEHILVLLVTGEQTETGFVFYELHEDSEFSFQVPGPVYSNTNNCQPPLLWEVKAKHFFEFRHKFPQIASRCRIVRTGVRDWPSFKNTSSLHEHFPIGADFYRIGEHIASMNTNISSQTFETRIALMVFSETQKTQNKVRKMLLTSSFEKRLELLAGMLDSFSFSQGMWETKGEKTLLKRALLVLSRVARSCGIRSVLSITTERMDSIKAKINLQGSIVKNIPCRTDFPSTEHNSPTQFSETIPFSSLEKFRIKPVGDGKYYGFLLSGETGRFLHDDFVVGHNCPRELGGLGMLSMGHILIPQSDLRYSKQTETEITHFRQGLHHEEGSIIPNLYRYVQPWEEEFSESKHVWWDYQMKLEEAREQNRPLSLEDVEESWDRGIPRINTLFCFALGTRVLMSTGEAKPVEDVVVGDLLLGDDSIENPKYRHRRIEKIHRGTDVLYRVFFKKPFSIIMPEFVCNSNHIFVLTLKDSAQLSGQIKKEILEDNIRCGLDSNHDVNGPILLSASKTFDLFNRYPHFEKEVGMYTSGGNYQNGDHNIGLNTYLLGLLLGAHKALFNIHSDICKDFFEQLESCCASTNLRVACEQSMDSSCKTVKIVDTSGGVVTLDELLSSLDSELHDTLPDRCFKCSFKDRVSLISGYLDGKALTQKNTDFGAFSIAFEEEALSTNVINQQICKLALSIGLQMLKSHSSDGTYLCFDASHCTYLETIFLKRPSHLCKSGYTRTAVPFELEQLEEGAIYGFEVDGNSRFLLESFCVTHNSKDHHILTFDKDWRSRQEYRMYSHPRMSSFWWTHTRHDGKLYNLTNYRIDMLQALGGVEAILEHSLFKGTGFPTWQGLFWSTNTSSFEEAMKFKKLTNAQRMGLNQIPNRRFTLWWSPTINRSNVYVGYQVQLDLTGVFMHGKIPTLKISLIQIFRAHLWQKIHESVVMNLCYVFDQQLSSLNIADVQKERIHPRKSYKMNTSCSDITLKAAYRWHVSPPSLLSEPRDAYPGETTSNYWLDVQLRWGDYDSHDIERYTRSLFLEYTNTNISQYTGPTGLMVGIDLAYNNFSAFGNWIPGMKPLITQAMSKIMRSNSALCVLRERIRRALQLFSSQPTEQYLNAQNYEALFSSENVWFVDDSQVYRVTVHQTYQGNTTTRAANGALLIFNPATGDLYMKILHSSVWADQKRRTQLAIWKAAEETEAVIRSLPVEQRPRQIICTRPGLLEPMEACFDFPNIVIKGSDLSLPFQAFLKIEKLGDKVMRASKNQTYLINMYDAWVETVSPRTCFLRLLLILRGLMVGSAETKAILRPSDSVLTEKGCIWPSLTDEQWAKVEMNLRDLILVNYSKRNNVNVQALTQGEIRDIILGQEITAPSLQRQLMAEIEQQKEDDPQVAAMASKTTDVHGDEIVTFTVTNYEQESFESKTQWRTRALAAANLRFRTRQIHVTESGPGSTIPYVLPRALFDRFVEIADLRTQICGLLYGVHTKSLPIAFEVRAIVLPPQWGTHRAVTIPLTAPVHPVLDELIPLGWIHTAPNATRGLAPASAALHATFLEKLPAWSSSCATVTVAFTPGSVTVSAHTLTEAGLRWTAENSDKALHTDDIELSSVNFQSHAVHLSDALQGSFLVSPDGLWNCFFSTMQVTPALKYELTVGAPRPFYHQLHRPKSFLSWLGEAPRDDGDVEDPLA